MLSSATAVTVAHARGFSSSFFPFFFPSSFELTRGEKVPEDRGELNGLDRAALAHRVGERLQEQPGAGADVGDRHAGLEPRRAMQHADDAVNASSLQP